MSKYALSIVLRGLVGSWCFLSKDILINYYKIYIELILYSYGFRMNLVLIIFSENVIFNFQKINTLLRQLSYNIHTLSLNTYESRMNRV